MKDAIYWIQKSCKHSEQDRIEIERREHPNIRRADLYIMVTKCTSCGKEIKTTKNIVSDLRQRLSR